MGIFGRRILHNKIQREVSAKVETRDAILWDVLPTQRVARVKIQGSDTLIIANYPLNWQLTPTWLKPGNAVRITHTEGIRGRIELVGHGTYVPTPLAGSMFPTAAVAADCILTGCRVMAMVPTALMMISVTAGSYRIGGTTYYLGAYGGTSGPVPMGSGMPMGTGLPMGYTGASGIVIDAAPSAGHFRVDIIAVGVDGVLDYLKGTEFTTTMVLPIIPTSHLECGRILLTHQTTAIMQEWIDRPWAASTPSRLVMTITDDDLAWAELTTAIVVEIQDQYGNPLTATAMGLASWYITMSFISGNGSIDGTPSPGTVALSTTGSSATCTYTRDQLDPGDQSPMIKALLYGDNPIQAIGYITLRDTDGDLMF